MSTLLEMMEEHSPKARRSEAQRFAVREAIDDGISRLLAGYLCQMREAYGYREIWIDRLEIYPVETALYALKIADRFFTSRPPTLAEIDCIASLCSEYSEHACTSIAVAWGEVFVRDEAELPDEPFLVTIRRLIKQVHESPAKKAPL